MGVPTLNERKQFASLPTGGPAKPEPPLPEDLVYSRPGEVYDAAVTLAENRMYSEALWYLMQVLRAQVSIYGSESYAVFRTQKTIGQTLLAARDPRRAIPYLRSSLKGIEHLFGQGDAETVGILLSLGRALCIAGDAPQGLTLLGQAEKVSEHWLGPLHPVTIAAIGTTGLRLGLDGQLQPAIDTLSKSIEQATLLGDDGLLSTVCSSMGLVQLLVGNTSEAVTNSEEAYRYAERNKDTNYSQLLVLQYNLGQSLCFDGREQGEQLMIDARDALSRMLGPEHPTVASVTKHLTRWHRDED
jgi:hypothetical protein